MPVLAQSRRAKVMTQPVLTPYERRVDIIVEANDRCAQWYVAGSSPANPRSILLLEKALKSA
jgi:hypothetical protein